MKYAIVDIGSNTIHMVVYDVDGKRIRKVLREKETAGLVGYIEQNGELSKPGADQLVTVLSDFCEVARSVAVDEFHAFATASLRMVSNRDEIVARVATETGVNVRILSGEEEAALDYTALRDEIGNQSGLMIDLGGGSAELVSFRNGVRENSATIALGSLSLYRSFVDEILPTKHELHEMSRYIKGCIADITWLPGCASTAHLLGGTGRAMGRLHMKMNGSSAPIDGYTMDPREIKKMRSELRGDFMPLIRYCPERIHTILPGMTVLHRILKTAGCSSLTIYNLGIREGFLKQYVLKR